MCGFFEPAPSHNPTLPPVSGCSGRTYLEPVVSPYHAPSHTGRCRVVTFGDLVKSLLLIPKVPTKLEYKLVVSLVIQILHEFVLQTNGEFEEYQESQTTEGVVHPLSVIVID